MMTVQILLVDYEGTSEWTIRLGSDRSDLSDHHKTMHGGTHTKIIGSQYMQCTYMDISVVQVLKMCKKSPTKNTRRRM